MEHEGLKAILAEAEAGEIAAARAALRPYLTGESAAPAAEVRYVLGRTFFAEDKATARYLFESALGVDPSLREAGEYEARCGSALEDLETFDDARHPPCDECHLRYRDHEPLCPYCGASVDPPRDDANTFESQLRDAGQDVMDSIREFAERDEVKRAREMAAAAAKVAVTKAKEFSESDRAKELKATAKAMGVVAARRARALGERQEVQTAKEKASKLGAEARDKAKAFSERDDVKEAVEKASTTSKNLMGKAQDYVKAEQERFNKGDSTERAKVVGKWFVILLVMAFVLKWLFGGD